MDFFDNALDKAKEALEVVSKKTEEVVTASKQKFNIASLENQCSKCYESLGKLYFEQLKGTDIEDNEVKDLVELISQKQEEIAKIKEELEASK